MLHGLLLAQVDGVKVVESTDSLKDALKGLSIVNVQLLSSETTGFIKEITSSVLLLLNFCLCLLAAAGLPLLLFCAVSFLQSG